MPPQPHRATNTWLVDYRPIIEQSLADLALWVEQDVEPQGTNFNYADGYVTLPATVLPWPHLFLSSR